MRKAAVRHGDSTTTGGTVIAISSTLYDDDKKIALSGDQATCGNCEGSHDIVATGEGMSEPGRCVVLDGDLVRCPCKENRVIVGANPGVFVECIGESQTIKSTARASRTDNSPFLRIRYDEQVCCASSSTAIDGYPYFIETVDGRTITGRLENDSRLPRVFTEAVEDYTVHWGDEALARQLEA
nr:hypothetical protein HUO10_006303 [Paraburkholderia busanensis]